MGKEPRGWAALLAGLTWGPADGAQAYQVPAVHKRSGEPGPRCPARLCPPKARLQPGPRALPLWTGDTGGKCRGGLQELQGLYGDAPGVTRGGRGARQVQLHCIPG